MQNGMGILLDFSLIAIKTPDIAPSHKEMSIKHNSLLFARNKYRAR